MNDNSLKNRIIAIEEICNILDGKSHKNKLYRDKLLNVLIGLSLRRMGEILFYLNVYIKIPLKKEKNIVIANLIAAITQILYMKTPNYAAVNTSVEISKIKSTNYTKLVNGVLRQIIRDINANKLIKPDQLINIPKKIKSRWSKYLTKKDIKQIFDQNMEMPPALDVTLNKNENINEWKKKLQGEVFGKNNIRIFKPTGKIENLYGYNLGKWWIQDFSAQIPATLLISSIRKNSKIIDMCAAPGGKTAQLLNYGADVTAIEINPKRAKLLRSNLKRLNFKTKIVVENAINYRPKTHVDGVLLDAPCSSTGTFRRNPDIPWRIEYDKDFNNKLNNLCKTQKNLLNSATFWLKPGGVLIYSVCSLEIEEGEKQIINFIKNNRNFDIKPIKLEEIDIVKKAITKQGFLKTLPSFYNLKGGIDGFFIARLIKKN